MDLSTIGGLTGLVAIVIVVGKEIYRLVNHSRCRSRCCSWTGVVSMDIEKTTPQAEKPFLEPNVGGLITLNEKGELEHYDAALGKKVPYKS